VVGGAGEEDLRRVAIVGMLGGGPFEVRWGGCCWVFDVGGGKVVVGGFEASISACVGGRFIVGASRSFSGEAHVLIGGWKESK